MIKATVRGNKPVVITTAAHPKSSAASKAAVGSLASQALKPEMLGKGAQALGTALLAVPNPIAKGVGTALKFLGAHAGATVAGAHVAAAVGGAALAAKKAQAAPAAEVPPGV